MKKILSGILSVAIIMSSMVAHADVNREAQSAELHTLLATCESNGYAVDYEKVAIEIFDWYAGLESEDATEGKLSSDQITYNATALTRIYTKIGTNLNNYISQGKSRYEKITFPPSGTRNISGNIFIDGYGRPLQSVGFGHSDDVFTDADLLKKIGSNNIQTEIGPSQIAANSDINLWKVVKNGGSTATATLQESGGDHYIRITNSEDDGSGKSLHITQTIPVEQGERYTISFMAKANTSTTIRVLPNGFGSTQQDFNIGTSETPITMTFTADSYYAQITIIKAIQGVPVDGELPSKNSFIEINNDKIVLAAIKKAEDKDGLIVRLWNKSDEDTTADMKISLPITKAELLKKNEEKLSDIPQKDGKMSVNIKKHKIVTIKLR